MRLQYVINPNGWRFVTAIDWEISGKTSPRKLSISDSRKELWRTVSPGRKGIQYPNVTSKPARTRFTVKTEWNRDRSYWLGTKCTQDFTF